MKYLNLGVGDLSQKLVVLVSIRLELNAGSKLMSYEALLGRNAIGSLPTLFEIWQSHFSFFFLQFFNGIENQTRNVRVANSK